VLDVFLGRGREALEPMEQKTLRPGDDMAGGYLAPGALLGRLIRRVRRSTNQRIARLKPEVDRGAIGEVV
jgi:hypothetical protein